MDLMSALLYIYVPWLAGTFITVFLLNRDPQLPIHTVLTPFSIGVIIALVGLIMEMTK